MKHLRYYHNFYDIENNLYRVEILQEAEQAYSPQEIELAGTPVTIEWGDTDKIETVMSSSATLRLISMTDRQFFDLYTVEPCSIRMDIYRNGRLYWSGTLDPELFEEPYSVNSRYVTECVFSDFGVLSRLSWQQLGVKTIREVVEECLRLSNVAYLKVEEQISTEIPDVEGSILDNCILSMDNFYDEDGTAWAAREVLDETLRPFALRLTQKNGVINIVDINKLSESDPQQVKWLNADASLGVEPTYNKVVLTYSPYSDATVYDGSFDSEEILPDITAAGVGQMAIPLPETDFNGFNFYYGPPYAALTKVQNLYVGGTARLFRIKPDNNGQESVGVMWGVRPFDSWVGNKPVPETYFDPFGDKVIMETPRIPLTVGSSDYRLKITLDVLFDVRKNPFEDANVDNEKGNWEDFQDWANYGGIPCELILYGYDGKVYRCENRSFSTTGAGRAFWSEESESSPQRRLMLEYYDEGNRKSASGFGGWATNKQNIQFTDDDLSKTITLNIEGEKIPMPPVAGDLVMRIYSGVLCRDNADIYEDIAGKVVEISRWLLYKDPKITVSQVSGKDITSEDMVVSAWINKVAEEELSVDTYIGCATNRTPLARGAILDASYAPIRRFRRAGVTDSIEKLLIGTIYSNYASRKNTLSGSINLIAEYSILSDASSVNSRFMLLSESQDLQAATSEVKMAEIAADSYEDIEYE